MSLDFTPLSPQGTEEDQLQPKPLTLSPKPEDQAAGGLSFTPLAPTQQPDSLEANTEGKSDILGAIKRGVETSLSPFTVDPNEVKQPHTTGEKVAETVANVGTDVLSSVAATAGAGALVGSVAPGLGTAAGALAGLGLGVYRALGYEDLQSKAKGEEFNWGRAGINVLAEVNPSLRLGGKFVKFLSQGALQAAQTLAYGGDTEDAAVSALIGGAIGAAGHHALRPGEIRSAGISALIVDPTMGPKAMQDVTEVLTDDGTRKTLLQMAHDDIAATPRTAVQNMLAQEGLLDSLAEGGDIQGLVERLGAGDLRAIGVDMETVNGVKASLAKAGFQGEPAELTRAAKEQSALLKIEQEATDVARFLARDTELTGKELYTKAVQELKATGLSIDGAVEAMRFQKGLNNAVEKAAEYATQRGLKAKDPLDNTLLRTLGDQKYAARISDHTTGLDLEPVFARVSVGKNKKNQFVFWVASTTNKNLKAAKKIGLERGKIAQMLEQGLDETHEDEATRNVLGSFRQLFDEVRTRANEGGLDVAFLDNYVTHITKDPAELITAIRREMREKYLKPDGGVSGHIFRDKPMLSFLQDLSGVKIERKEDVLKIMNMLDDPSQIKKAEGFAATAAYKREGKLPEWAREQDIGRVMLSYANNLGNAMYMDPAIRELELRVPALKTLGHKNSAEWLERQIGRLSGQKSQFLQWMSNSTVRWKSSIDQLLDTQELNGLQQRSLKIAKFAPDLVSWGMSQIYPNYLGFSVKAVVRNLSQPHLLSGTDVGGWYGQKIATRAAIEAALDRRRGVDLQKALEAEGLHPGEHIGEGMNQLHNALEKTALGGLVKASDEVAKVGMYIYGKTDAVNRYITWKMAKRVARDIETGLTATTKTADQEAALKFFKGLPAGYRGDMYRSARKGEGIERGLTEYLLSTTQFDYGPQALSQFGQDYGRFVSMFTKWPAMVIGDVHYLAATKQYTKAMQKYLAPFAALAAVDVWLDGTHKDPRMRAILGESMKDWSPLASMKVSAPPVLDVAGHAGKSFLDVVSLDLKGAAREAGKALEPLAPFNSLNLGLKDKLLYNILKNKKAPEFLAAR